MLKIALVLLISSVVVWGSIIPKFGGESDKVDSTFIRDNNKSIVIDTKNRKIYNDSSYGSDMTFDKAQEYCSSMRYLGVDSWRVPTKDELTSLLELSRRPIAIKHAFINVQEGIYWSSTKDRRNDAWYVDFDLGRYYVADRDKRLFVMCVRDVK